MKSIALTVSLLLVLAPAALADDGYDQKPPHQDPPHQDPHNEDPEPERDYYVKIRSNGTTVPTREAQHPCSEPMPRDLWPLPRCIYLGVRAFDTPFARSSLSMPLGAYAYYNATAGTYGIFFDLPFMMKSDGGNGTSGGTGGTWNCHHCPPPPAHVARCVVMADDQCAGPPSS